MTDHWQAAGVHAIANPEEAPTPLPWKFRDTVFRCAWEYSVPDFETEVGFWTGAMGFATLALDDEYALFTTPERDFTFACHRGGSPADLSGHILCFMTRDIESFGRALARRLPHGVITQRSGSPVQTVFGLRTPAGLQVDIWEFPS